MRLKDKVAIITGAGMGMGREASVIFAREGAKVVVFDINEAAANETAALIAADGGEALVVVGDVSKEADVKGAIDAGVAKFGKLDILYANAGVLNKKLDLSVIDTTEENWDRMQAINLKGPFFLTKHGIPALKQSGGGSIILVGSISALVGFTMAQDSYTCAKGALIALTILPFLPFVSRPPAHLAEWGWLVWFGAINTALASQLYLYALRHLSASSCGAFVAMEPVYAITFAALLFHDPISPRTLVSGVVILAASYLLSRVEADPAISPNGAPDGHEI